MVLSQQEMSDRIEIADLLTRYSSAIDRRVWSELDALFCADATLDYTATGGIVGTLAEHQAYNARVLPGFQGTQHLMALPVVDVTGDTATARTPCFNPMVVDGRHVFFVGLWYLDQLVRTPSGWRFHQRVEELSFFHNLHRPA